MKCPQCSFDQKVKYGMKCGRCSYAFTFNPKDSSTLGMTDGKFLACVRSASQNDTAWFTENQFYAAFCRRIAKPIWPSLIFALVLLVVGGIVAASGSIVIGGLIISGAVLVALFALFGTRKSRRSEFERLLNKWKADDKRIERLIVRPALHEPPPEWSEPDIYDYGVERVLIVERDILVDLFVKNGVHAEQRMLVLAESGYPEYLQGVARRLFAEQPTLPIFLLHDATEHGCDMEKRLRTSGMLPIEGHPIIDFGMSPADFQKLKRTKFFDPDNEERRLPVDALMLPFLTMALGTAMAQGTAFGAVIEAQQQGSDSGGGFDFG